MLSPSRPHLHQQHTGIGEQTVTVTGVEDPDADNETVAISYSVSHSIGGGGHGKVSTGERHGERSPQRTV